MNRGHIGGALCGQLAQLGLHRGQATIHCGQRVPVVVGSGAVNQRITILAQCGQLTAIRHARARLPAVGQVYLLPTHRRLDGIERGDSGTKRHVVSVRGQGVQLRQREDVVILAQGKLRGCHADESGAAATGIKTQCLELGVREIFLGEIAEQRQAFLERRIVRGLDLEARGKTESIADAVEVILARMQHDTAQRDAASKVHLHPLRRVLILLNVAVVTHRVAFLGGLRQRGDFLVQIHERLAGPGENPRVQLLLPRREFGLAIRQLATLLRHSRIDIILFVRAIHRGEHRLQAVVILLRDGVEFVVVTLRALHGQAVEGLHGVRHHVIAVQMARDHAVHLRLRHLRVPDEIPRPGRDEPECLETIACSREQHIARQLLLHETRVGLVLVEAADDVIAIRPRVRARLILVVAVRLAVVNDVQPVPRPALAVVRRREQSFHQLFVGLRVLVRSKRFDLLRLRRQAGQVEVESANQRAPVRF